MTRLRVIRVSAFLVAALAVSAYAQPGGRPAQPQSPGSGVDTPSAQGAEDKTRERSGSGQADSGMDALRSFLGSAEAGYLDAGTKTAILELAAPALAAGVPEGAFSQRIREAVAKRASPAAILDALAVDADAWTRIVRLPGFDVWPPSDKASVFYLSAGAALRNGLGLEAVRGVHAWAMASGGDPERAGAALTAAAAVAYAFGQPCRDDLARIIAASRLHVGQFGHVAEFARRAGSAGMGTDAFGMAVADVLASGGNLSALERRLFP